MIYLMKFLRREIGVLQDVPLPYEIKTHLVLLKETQQKPKKKSKKWRGMLLIKKKYGSH